MQQVYISLPTVQRVQKFVQTLTPLSGDFELVAGKFVLDARSLMGVFSLDIAKPICLNIYDASAENLLAIKPFLADFKEEQA